MTLSASIIARNEASEIEACLDSLLGVDEIVVVDTGSEDETREMVAAWAAAHPDTSVVQGSFEWIDDFAAARNYAAALCSGDWILTISADGRMAPGAIDAIREALPSVAGSVARIWQESIRGGQRHRRGLIHRPGVQWAGAIHENLDPSHRTEDIEATMLYGWSASHHCDPRRNLRILQREWDREPTARTAYYLGGEYWDRGNYGEAKGWFQKCAAMTQWRAERADAHLYLAKIAWRENEGDTARRHCLDSLANVPECKEALLLMAEMSWPEQAATWRRFAEIATNSGCIFIREK